MMNKEIVFDTETTGLFIKPDGKGDRIIEIGAVELIDKVKTNKTFHTYVNPGRKVSSEAYKIHGISNSFLSDKPIFKDIAHEFLDFIKDAKLVAHNASFDMRFLNHELSLINEHEISFDRAIDTLAIARKKFPGKKVNLDALCKILNIDNSHRVLHGADIDAELLVQVYLELTGDRQVEFAVKSNSEKKVVYNKIINYCHNVIYASEREKETHEELLTKIKDSLWYSN